MMKINVEFDTQDKTIIASMNGKKISNLSSIYFYVYDGKANVELSTLEADEEEKTVKVTRVMADNKDELVIKEKPLHEELAELLSFKK